MELKIYKYSDFEIKTKEKLQKIRIKSNDVRTRFFMYDYDEKMQLICEINPTSKDMKELDKYKNQEFMLTIEPIE